MASRRVPLTDIPNAVNSPFRNPNAVNGKRTRAQAGDAVYGQPPAKKHIVEAQHDEDGENVDPRVRTGVAITTQAKLDEPFTRRPTNTQPSAFTKKLASVRERKPSTQPQQRAEKPQKATDRDNLESIRQWQRHYRRQFPTFVLYFESVPEDVHNKAAHQIKSLGAKEEKFFSKAVTHVITTREIPPNINNTSPDDDGNNDSRSNQTSVSGNPQRQPDADPRKIYGATDILSRSRELGIKIWALEKLQRMLRTMFETDADGHNAGHDTRSHAAAGKTAVKPSKDADLELLLRNEKINGPADRDMGAPAQDMCNFRGYYLYIHDMNEKTKPSMVRDYDKPAAKEAGKWPQFRLTAEGRCPFIEDPAYTKKLQQREREAQAAKGQDDVATAQRRTRAAACHDATTSRPLAEQQPNLRRSPRKQGPVDLSKPLDPPRLVPSRRQDSAENIPPMFGSAQLSHRGLPRMVGGEPVASGIQMSNITSAIRSQAISSAAISSTAPGAARRVDSKEVTALKRKVLERGASITSNHSIPSSYMNDMRAALNNDEPPPRAAKRKALETLGVLHEGDESTRDQHGPKHRKPPPRSRKPTCNDSKAGYCENCRDKFDDFDEVRHYYTCLSHARLLTIHSTVQLANIANSLSLRRIGRSLIISLASSNVHISTSDQDHSRRAFCMERRRSPLVSNPEIGFHGRLFARSDKPLFPLCCWFMIRYMHGVIHDIFDSMVWPTLRVE